MSSGDEEDWPEVEHPPEFDIRITRALIAALQKRGENVLMDELIFAAENVDEWDVARVLDVLVGLQLAGVERQRGNPMRNSRAFTHRTGYALPREVPLETLRDAIEQQEALIAERTRSIQQLKEQLKSGDEQSDVEFLRAYAETAPNDTIQTYLRRFLDTMILDSTSSCPN